MKFDIAMIIDQEASHKSGYIVLLKEALKDYFEEKDYGKDLQEILISFICTKARLGNENYLIKKVPQYVAYKTAKNMLTGEVIEKNRYFYNIKLDDEQFDFFVSCSNEECQKFLSIEIINSLVNLDSLPKKVEDFDKEQFKKDTQSFLCNGLN